MIVGCYTLDLYCDSDTEQPYKSPGHDMHPDQFIGHTEAACIRQAKADGWKFGKREVDGRLAKVVVCPLCAGKKVKP